MKTSSIISFLLIILITKLTYSQDAYHWIYYGTTVDNKIICTYYYDTTFIIYGNNNNKIKVWSKVTYDPWLYSDYYGRNIYYEKYYTVIYCNTRKYSIIERNYYFKDNSREFKSYSDTNFVSIVSDSMGETLFDILCK
jgi:hypothetical protein